MRNKDKQGAAPRLRGAAGGALALSAVGALLLGIQPAYAIGTTVDLGTASTYSVLGGQSVTNTGSSVLAANLGVSPKTAITGFPPGITLGAKHPGDAHALQAQADVVTAYDNVAGQQPDASLDGEIGDLTLLPGVYNASSSLGLTGTLSLDAQGDPNAVFIFQTGSTLITGSNSTVELLNGATSCNVFWQVGSSATLGTGTTFVGNILALTTITANTGATVEGRALARNGSVTLDANVFTRGACEPELPIEPELPVEPEEPVEPELPVEPVEPTEPELPIEPPAGPVEPPIVPAEPEVPSEPVAPTAPPIVNNTPPVNSPPVAPPGTQKPPELPVTGSATTTSVLVAVGSILAGIGLVVLSARHARKGTI